MKFYLYRSFLHSFLLQISLLLKKGILNLRLIFISILYVLLRNSLVG